MKQSSIEWIYNNLKSHFEHDGDLLEAVKMSFEQAKAMHKEEMDKVSEDWFVEGCSHMNHNKRIYQSFEQYYNQTYKQPNKNE